MREDVLAHVLGMSASEVAVLAQRGMPTYCWTAARDWCLLNGYLPVQVQAPTPPVKVLAGPLHADSFAPRVHTSESIQ